MGSKTSVLLALLLVCSVWSSMGDGDYDHGQCHGKDCYSPPYSYDYKDKECPPPPEYKSPPPPCPPPPPPPEQCPPPPPPPEQCPPPPEQCSPPPPSPKHYPPPMEQCSPPPPYKYSAPPYYYKPPVDHMKQCPPPPSPPTVNCSMCFCNCEACPICPTYPAPPPCPKCECDCQLKCPEVPKCDPVLHCPKCDCPSLKCDKCPEHPKCECNCPEPPKCDYKCPPPPKCPEQKCDPCPEAPKCYTPEPPKCDPCPESPKCKYEVESFSDADVEMVNSLLDVEYVLQGFYKSAAAGTYKDATVKKITADFSSQTSDHISAINELLQTRASKKPQMNLSKGVFANAMTAATGAKVEGFDTFATGDNVLLGASLTVPLASSLSTGLLSKLQGREAHNLVASLSSALAAQASAVNVMLLERASDSVAKGVTVSDLSVDVSKFQQKLNTLTAGASNSTVFETSALQLSGSPAARSPSQVRAMLKELGIFT